MPPSAAIIVPTQRRASYLDVALGSIAPQAAAAGAELLVVDDGPDPQTRAVAERHEARYVPHDAPRGLNAARNTGLDATHADLLVFVDDDVAVRPGWLAALLGAADALDDDVGVLTGPIHARFEDHALRMCGREGPPITFTDLGPADTDAPHAWGANMTLRRSAIARAGRFDEARPLYGDEQEWQARLLAAGGRIRYIAGAALDHRRTGDDARLRNLCAAAHARGIASRRYDVFKGTAPPLRGELRVLAGCAVHTLRRACANGVVMAAHSAGRTREALRPVPVPATPGVDDFLSGHSGTVGGARGALARARDALADVRSVRPRHALRRAAAEPALARRRVLVLGAERPGSRMDAARIELETSRHDVAVHTTGVEDRGKFENLDALLAAHPPGDADWLLVVDDDVDLPRGFLDAFLLAAERAGLKLAQPAHRRHSHAAWAHTRRRGAGVRPTTFVEIGPVTAFHRDTFAALLPFPAELRMGWGLDAHWSAVAREQGWPLGIVDATPIGHTQAPAASGYSRDAALAEAQAFLAGRAYIRRDEVR